MFGVLLVLSVLGWLISWVGMVGFWVLVVMVAALLCLRLVTRRR